jgi:hypothetical protein
MGRRCETEASIPLDAIRRPRDTPIWTLEAALKCRSCGRRRYKPPVHMSSDARDHALIFGCIQTRIARKRAGDAILSPCRLGKPSKPGGGAKCSYGIILHPPTNYSERAWREVPRHMMRPERPYLDRNRNIVRETASLIAAPAEPEEQLRSGTWSTV